MNYANDCLWDIHRAYFNVKRDLGEVFPCLELLCFGVVCFPMDVAVILCSQTLLSQYICLGHDSQRDRRHKEQVAVLQAEKPYMQDSEWDN